MQAGLECSPFHSFADEGKTGMSAQHERLSRRSRDRAASPPTIASGAKKLNSPYFVFRRVKTPTDDIFCAVVGSG